MKRREFVSGNLGNPVRTNGVFVRDAAEVAQQNQVNVEHEDLVKRQLADRGPITPHFSSAGPQVEPVKIHPPFQPKRIGSPSEDVVQAEHQKLVQKLIEDRKKADAASALEHAATASSTAPKGKPSGEIPDSNIYIRER